MVKLFRKIRYKLMETGKTTKYIKYAIGEIVLVVIGILLALAINSWNEKQKELKQEQKILTSLLKEFSASKKDLAETISSNDVIYGVIHEIYKHTGSKWNDSLSRKQSDSLMSRFLGLSTADISTTYLDELINTGMIRLIKNDSLQYLLTNWKKELVDHKTETEDEMAKFRADHYFPYITKNYSLYMGRIKTEIDAPSGFDLDYTKIYQNMEFENLLLIRLNRLNRAKREYKILIDEADKIISLIKSEYRND